MTFWQVRDRMRPVEEKPELVSIPDNVEDKPAYPKKGKRARAKDVEESVDVEADSG